MISEFCTSTQENNQNLKDSEAKKIRLPKTKVALFMGYNGDGYRGMQYQNNFKTVESTLFDALCKSGAVSVDNSTDISKVGFMRACRTDKGVHAAAPVGFT